MPKVTLSVKTREYVNPITADDGLYVSPVPIGVDAFHVVLTISPTESTLAEIPIEPKSSIAVVMAK